MNRQERRSFERQGAKALVRLARRRELEEQRLTAHAVDLAGRIRQSDAPGRLAAVQRGIVALERASPLVTRGALEEMRRLRDELTTDG